MKRRSLAATAIALLVCTLPLAAQNSSLQGTVRDDHGAVIPEAIVSIVNQETKAPRKEVSSAMGAYQFLQVPPGTYNVEVQKSGFRTHTTSVVLQVNTPAKLDVKMELGQVTETVNVTDEVALVNTQNASIGNPFTEKQIKELPIQTRNIVDLLGIQPGVAPGGEVLGAKRDQNNVTLDGVDANDNQYGVNTATGAGNSGFFAALPVPLDSVQEFRTTVAGQGADQGRSSGGQVAIVTKSGSNQFHGSAYEYNRNTATEANNWFSNRAGIARQALIRNQYGASLGGRIIRDRLFFFANWEDRKDRSAAAQTRIVPSETLKQGIVQLRLSNGTIGQLTPAQVVAADPLHAGASSYMLKYLQSFPAGNDPAASADRGLNFSILRFNAPQPIDNRAYVARMDYNIDSAGRHTVMVRATLAANSQVNQAAQFPGQAPAQQLLDNSRGISARYTAVLSPGLINTFNYGLTRFGNTQTGIADPSVSFYFATPTAFPRSSTRIAPTHDFVDDMTWSHGTHSVQFGANFRIVNNNRTSLALNPTYSFSKNTLKGLGADIQADVTAVAQSLYGSGLTLTEGTNVTNAMGALLGVVNSYGATFQFGTDGKAIPYGSPVLRAYGTREYELYIQDTFKWRRDLTFTYGLRYSIAQPPYERNGVEVVPTTSLDQYFADRNGASALGIPGYALSTADITYALGGPANGKPGWYSADKKDWAPRFSLAYAPEVNGLPGKLFGKGSAIRAGAGIAYDRYGSAMAAQFASSGSPGLSTQVAQPVNTDFTTSYRYTGGGLPSLNVPTGGGFPYTPPNIVGGFNISNGVSPNLKAPYSYLLNATYSRPLPGKLSLEVGYVGRLSHRGILLQDLAQPLTNFKDVKSGQTWTQASGILRSYYDQGLTPAQVKANPNLLPKVAFFEDIFPGASGYNFSGSATANYYYTAYGTYAGSDLDGLNDMDRGRQANGTCISIYGCNTFFGLQSSSLQAYENLGKAAYHGMQLTLRRQYSNGFSFDFNYTLSHSIDNSSGWENGATVIQDSFNPNAYRGPSDFDIRHNVTMNYVYELPIGRNKKLLGSAPKWLDTVVGGWQISGIGTFRSGPPLTLSNGGLYPTNYENSAIGILKPGATMPANTVGLNNLGNPSLFSTVTAVNSFEGQYPGTVGTRGIIRGASQVNMDMAASKFFKLPWEGHQLQLRAEAFNAFNNVNFINSSSITSQAPNLSLQSPGTFGQFNAAADPRSMQFALRYIF